MGLLFSKKPYNTLHIFWVRPFGATYMLRFGPSPTGDMHIGTLRVAIINFLVAQQKEESFLVRIEDADIKESQEDREGKDTEIIQILEKFALSHESVFHQSEHLRIHQTLAVKLLEEGKAFVCTCSPELTEANNACLGCCENKDKTEHAKLKESATPFVLRLKKPKVTIVFHDLLQGDISTSPDELDAFIILRADGTPTANFATACDDMLSGVTMVIRDEEHLKHTPRQIHIQNLLGYDVETSYAHLPALSDTYSVKWMFEQGYIPDAIINYLLLLGNKHVPNEIFTLPEAIAWFKLENLSQTTSKFDIDKLRFINREHLRRMDDKQLSTLFGFADADVGKLAKLYLDEASTINELALKIRPVFAAKVFEGTWKEEMKIMQDIIFNAPMIDDFNAFKNYIMLKSDLEEENLIKALRLLLTGAEHGPKLSDIYPLIKSYLLEIAS